jgi:clan AA aspartic protease
VGLTHVTVEVLPLTGRRSFASEFLVDTGAIDCLAPSKLLRKIGIKPARRDVYELADGTSIEMPVGFARVRFMGDETVTKIVFGSDDAEPILGVVALESTGIAVDPVTRTLRRMTAKPLKLHR